MNRIIKSGLVVAILLLSAVITSAEELPPPIPAKYSGKVIVNGSPAPDSATVYAQVKNSTGGYGDKSTASTVTGGHYGPLSVSVPDSSFIGGLVEFYVNAPGYTGCPCKANETDIFAQGTNRNLDISLVVTVSPTTPTPTPTTTQSSGRGSTGGGGSSSGGSGGGGGVISGEPFANIAKSETRDGSLIAGKPVAFTFKSLELAIHQTLVTGKENENDVSVRVESLKNTSKLVAKPAPGTVYINENVWVNSKKVSNVVLKFRVKNAWITGSNVRKENIKLLRWSDNDWKYLDTTVLSSDETYTYFESPSTGLSSFAVSAVTEGQVFPVETIPQGAASTAPVDASTPKKPTPGFGLLVAVLAALAIYMLRKKGR